MDGAELSERERAVIAKYGGDRRRVPARQRGRGGCLKADVRAGVGRLAAGTETTRGARPRSVQ